MQDLLINNMYAAYSATSSHVDNKSVSELSRMVKAEERQAQTSEDKELLMDKVIISKEALSLLRTGSPDNL